MGANKNSCEATDSEPLMIPLWPDVGRALNLSRNGAYDAAKRGEIPAKRYGRLLRVPRAWLVKETSGT